MHRSQDEEKKRQKLFNRAHDFASSMSSHTKAFMCYVVGVAWKVSVRMQSRPSSD